MATFAQMQQAPFLGDFVRTAKYGYRGRVYKLHHNCPENQTWIRGQAIPLTEDELADKWVSVLVHDGGAALVPASDCTIIDAFELRNDSASMYFRDHNVAAAENAA